MKNTIRIAIAGTTNSGKSRVARVIQRALSEQGFEVTLTDDDHPHGCPDIDPEVLRKYIVPRSRIDIGVVQMRRDPADSSRHRLNGDLDIPTYSGDRRADLLRTAMRMAKAGKTVAFASPTATAAGNAYEAMMFMASQIAESAKNNTVWFRGGGYVKFIAASVPEAVEHTNVLVIDGVEKMKQEAIDELKLIPAHMNGFEPQVVEASSFAVHVRQQKGHKPDTEVCIDYKTGMPLQAKVKVLTEKPSEPKKSMIIDDLTTPRCECGAAKTGIKPRAHGHSDWCPAR